MLPRTILLALLPVAWAGQWLSTQSTDLERTHLLLRTSLEQVEGKVAEQRREYTATLAALSSANALAHQHCERQHARNERLSADLDAARLLIYKLQSEATLKREPVRPAQSRRSLLAIDVENVGFARARRAVEEVARSGRASDTDVSIYTRSLPSPPSKKNAFPVPVRHVLAHDSRKNAADAALIADVSAALFSGKYDSIHIASEDHIFHQLVGEWKMQDHVPQGVRIKVWDKSMAGFRL